MMSLFNSILQGLEKKIKSENAYKEIVVEVIQQILNIKKIPHLNISLRDNILYIQTNPLIKAAILLKKEKIIHKLNERGITVVVIK